MRHSNPKRYHEAEEEQNLSGSEDAESVRSKRNRLEPQPWDSPWRTSSRGSGSRTRSPSAHPPNPNAQGLAQDPACDESVRPQRVPEIMPTLPAPQLPTHQDSIQVLSDRRAPYVAQGERLCFGMVCITLLGSLPWQLSVQWNPSSADGPLSYHNS